MRYLNIFIVILALLLLPSVVLAGHNGRSVTPYGDFCPRCSNYGFCKSILSHEDSEKAIVDYYNKKGLNIEIVNIRGRFIKAKIKDKNIVVDEIIFDRRTGRIRSIY